MDNSNKRRDRRLISFTIRLAILFVAGGCLIMNRGDSSGLEPLRLEPVLELVYPGATRLHRIETPRKDVPLEGIIFGAQIRDFYGANVSDKEIETFYREELEQLGWDFLGVAGGRLDTYRRLIYRKDPLSLQIRFWFREDFERQLPSVNTEGIVTIYELLIIGQKD